MANSLGLNDRPSRTSLRGVATLYQGSIAIPLLRSLQAREQVGRRSLQSGQIGIGHVLKTASARVHPVADAVGDDHIPRNPERLHVPLSLFQRAFDARTQALGFDHEMTVFRRARQGPKHGYVDVAPLDGDPLRR